MPTFTNEEIEIDLLPKYQEIRLNAPHPNYWKVIFINIGICMGIITVALASLIFFVVQVRPFIIYAIVGTIVIFTLIFLLFKASFKKRGYALREKDIIYKSGIIAETTSIIPLNRIQHVALDEGMFSRIYQLATLQIYTAGGGTGHMHIAGIPINEARNIKEALLRKLDLLENATE